MGMRARWMRCEGIPSGHLLASNIGPALAGGTERTTSGWPLAMLLSLREPKVIKRHVCWSYLFCTALSSGPSLGREIPGQCGETRSKVGMHGGLGGVRG